MFPAGFVLTNASTPPVSWNEGFISRRSCDASTCLKKIRRMWSRFLVLLPGLHGLQPERLWRHAEQVHRVHGVCAREESEESAQCRVVVDDHQVPDEKLHHTHSHARPLCHSVLIRTDNVGTTADAVVPQGDELVGHHVI